MRDDEIRRLLTDASPWWRAAARGESGRTAVQAHRLLRNRARYDLGYRSTVLADVASAPLTDALVLLTGPRRVGKSVALLDLAAALCDRSDLEPLQVLHVPCDGMTGRDLRRVFTLGRQLTRAIDRDRPARRAWLLDEVSAIAGWTAIVKAARDGTDLGDDTVIITGSHWREDEDVQGNLLAGRAGTSGTRRVRHLLPMTFRDYVAAAHPQLSLFEAVHPGDLQDSIVARGLEELRLDVDAYDLAWQDFLSCGGFPRAVAEHVSTGMVSDDFIRDLGASLRGDIRLDGPPDALPLLLDQLTARATSPLNVASTAESLGWTRKVLSGRLHRLVASFAAVWCHRHNDGGHRVPGAQPKLYLTDPLFAWLSSRLRSGLRAPETTSLTEQTIAVALARAVDEIEEGRWLAGDTIGFVRTESGNEIDLGPVRVPRLGNSEQTAPIEAKWVETGWRSEAKALENKYRRGVIATKSVLDLDHPTWAIPAPLVALLLA